jgi:hypothetical protein
MTSGPPIDDHPQGSNPSEGAGKTALRIAVALVLFALLVVGTSFAIVAGVDKLASRNCGAIPSAPAAAPQSPEVRTLWAALPAVHVGTRAPRAPHATAATAQALWVRGGLQGPGGRRPWSGMGFASP